VIIGGGPGGLAAGIYLARYRISCVVLDAGGGRASSIPRCRNFPGFPDGIPGAELLSRMREQFRRYSNGFIEVEALALDRTEDGFVVPSADRGFAGRTALIATGMLDAKAPFESKIEHDEALAAGYLHYCPVCDGYEVSGKRVTVFGSGHHGVKESLFLRNFTDEVELVCPSGIHALSDQDRAKLRAAHIALVDGPIADLQFENDGLQFVIGNSAFKTKSLYVAMGCKQRSSLAAMTGATVSSDGCIAVDAHQRTNVKGLYAVGDVVAGLDQIVTAIGQAAIAATAIRNELRGAEN
jgi:thioredoxin reductase (NADPH)